MSFTIFDTSALLALFLKESGHEIVENKLQHDILMSAANWSELAQKIPQKGLNWQEISAFLESSALEVCDVVKADAELAATLWQPGTNLSLADRLCLALGQRLNAEILTADKDWAGMPGVTVIR